MPHGGMLESSHDCQSADHFGALASFLALLCLQVVNICLEGKEGTRYKWLPEVASPHVHVVHIQLHGDYSCALVTWESDVEEPVAIVGGHGQLEFFPGPVN